MNFFPKIIFLLFAFVAAQVSAQNRWNIRYYHEIEGREAIVYADNDEWMPMSTQFKFKLENMTSTLKEGETVVIPAKTKRFPVTRFTPAKPNTKNGFQYYMTINFGDALQEKYDDSYIYSLPFDKGKTQRIFQGYNGNFSHQGAYALDFDLKTGEKVFAAREGLVVEAVGNNTKSCPDISCAKFNNRVIILHSDGTFADYSHLKFNGLTVKAGTQVEKGQLIGHSGQTGFANGPHLHFSVFLNRIDGTRDYIKTKFRTSASEGEILQEKASYTRNY